MYVHVEKRDESKGSGRVRWGVVTRDYDDDDDGDDDDDDDDDDHELFLWYSGPTKGV